MKLYSWIRNERGNNKTQGGNKVLDFSIDYEEAGQDYKCNTSEHALRLMFMLAGNGTPTIYVQGNKSFQIVDKR